MSPISIFLLSDALPPPLHLGELGSTDVNAVPVILIAGALGLYLWGVVRVNRLQPRHCWSAWRTTAFSLP
ncbi:MAG TPA: hypothetical protein VMQ59_15175, partial [Acidimicrobiales bacterium]|nr:hypothetical protein [Acidimicrobiales bacterium]